MPPTSPTSPEDQPSQPETPQTPEQVVLHNLTWGLDCLMQARTELAKAWIEQRVVPSLWERVDSAMDQLKAYAHPLVQEPLAFMEFGLYHQVILHRKRDVSALMNISGIPWRLYLISEDDPPRFEIRHYNGGRTKYRITDAKQLLAEHDWRFVKRPPRR